MFSEGQRKGLLWIFVDIMAAGLAFHLYDRLTPAPGGVSLKVERESGPLKSEKTLSLTRIYVHLCGAVNKPGVYGVPEGCRLFEVLKLAGGLAPDADGNAVNLARVVKDGERVYIPRLGEKGRRQETIGSSFLSHGDGKRTINVNTATREELEKLPGIGRVIADRIVKYRARHGFFKSPKDLLRVKGIGKRKLEKIRSMISF